MATTNAGGSKSLARPRPPVSLHELPFGASSTRVESWHPACRPAGNGVFVNARARSACGLRANMSTCRAAVTPRAPTGQSAARSLLRVTTLLLFSLPSFLSFMPLTWHAHYRLLWKPLSAPLTATFYIVYARRDPGKLDFSIAAKARRFKRDDCLLPLSVAGTLRHLLRSHVKRVSSYSRFNGTNLSIISRYIRRLAVIAEELPPLRCGICQLSFSFGLVSLTRIFTRALVNIFPLQSRIVVYTTRLFVASNDRDRERERELGDTCSINNDISPGPWHSTSPPSPRVTDKQHSISIIFPKRNEIRSHCDGTQS